MVAPDPCWASCVRQSRPLGLLTVTPLDEMPLVEMPLDGMFLMGMVLTLGPLVNVLLVPVTTVLLALGPLHLGLLGWTMWLRNGPSIPLLVLLKLCRITHLPMVAPQVPATVVTQQVSPEWFLTPRSAVFELSRLLTRVSTPTLREPNRHVFLVARLTGKHRLGCPLLMTEHP